MTLKCGKNKKVAHEPLGECVTGMQKTSKNVVRTSVTHSPNGSGATFFVLSTFFTSSMINYWTDARQHGIYLFNCVFILSISFSRFHRKSRVDDPFPILLSVWKKKGRKRYGMRENFSRGESTDLCIALRKWSVFFIHWFRFGLPVNRLTDEHAVRRTHGRGCFWNNNNNPIKIKLVEISQPKATTMANHRLWATQRTN